MIAICDHCGEKREKVWFCSTKCRVAHHRGEKTGEPPVQKPSPKDPEFIKQIGVKFPKTESTLDEKPRFTTHPTEGYHLVASLGKYMLDN